MITGATMFTPKGMVRGAPKAAHSSSKMCFCTAFQPVPPNSTGQWLAYQPCSLRARCQRWWSCLFRCLPRRTLLAMSAGSLSRRKARTWSRKASSSGVKWMSMAVP
jgi:hypothetical protein